MAEPFVAEQKIILRLSIDGEGLGMSVRQMIKTWAASGMSEEAILAQLQTQLSPGGTLFERIMAGFRNATGEAVAFISQEQVHADWQGEDSWTWVAIRDANTCEDCETRHGEMRTWDEWVALGLPGSGATVCGYRCRCELVPAVVGKNVKDPLTIAK